MQTQFFILLFFVNFCIPTFSFAQQLPDDNRWSDSFGGHIEFNNQIWKIETSEDYIYAFGEFTRVGGELANGFAKWDGNTWSPMIGGPCMLHDRANTNPYCRFEFQQFAVAGEYVYAGADLWDPVSFSFTPVLLQWDGQTWSVYFELDSSRDVITALFVDGDPELGGEVIYAAGTFSGVRQIIRLEGQTWESIGTVNSSVFLMDMAGEDLYIGGNFSEVGDVPVNKIARWNGSQWDGLGVEFTGPGLPIVDDMFVDNGNVYFTGNISGLNGDLTPLSVIKWNGQQWETYSDSFNEDDLLGTGKRIAVIGPDIYLSGGFFSTRGAVEDSELGVIGMISWDGASTNLESIKGLTKESGAIKDLAIWGDKVVVAEGTRVSTLDANVLQPVDSPNKGFNGPVVRLSADDQYLYAGGDFTTVDGGPSSFVARWDGQDWERYGNALNGQVKNLEVVNGIVYAAGSTPVYPYLTEVNGEKVTPIAMLKDGSWQPFPFRFRTDADDTIGRASIWNLKKMGDDLFVLGRYTMIDDQEAPGGVARWNGTSWITYPSNYSLEGLVFDVAEFGGELYAAGFFEAGPDSPGTAIVKWGGTDWTPVGNDNFPKEPIYQLLSDAETLYAVGRKLYRLQDNEWEVLGDAGITWGSSFRKGAAILEDSSIFVGGPISLGTFIEIEENCGFSTAYVGRWEEGSLSPLGSATRRCGVAEYFAQNWVVNELVNDIELFDGFLYTAGDFTYAGGKPANYISRWNLAASITSVERNDEHASRFTLSNPYPNPFSGSVSFSIDVPTTQQVTIEVYDILGKRVGRVLDGYKEAGTHQLQWKPRGLSSGAYFILAQTEYERQFRKVVYVRK